MLTKIIAKNMQSSGGRLNCLSFAEYSNHLILAQKG